MRGKEKCKKLVKGERGSHYRTTSWSYPLLKVDFIISPGSVCYSDSLKRPFLYVRLISLEDK